MLDFVFRHPFILVIGLALVVLGVFVASRKHQRLMGGHLASGNVVRLEPRAGSKGGTVYASVVEYVQADGTKSEFTTSTASSPPMHQVGDVVRVVYYADAAEPDLLDFADLYLLPWILICSGLFVLMIYVGFVFGPGMIDGLYLPRFQPAPAIPSGIPTQ